MKVPHYSIEVPIHITGGMYPSYRFSQATEWPPRMPDTFRDLV